MLGRQRGTSKVITPCLLQSPLWRQLDVVPFFISCPKVVGTAALGTQQQPGPSTGSCFVRLCEMSLVALAPQHISSRVYETSQSTGRNDMLRAGDVLWATSFVSTRDQQHLTGKLRLGGAGTDIIS